MLLPAEPCYVVDHAQITKNESFLFKYIARSRLDPLKAARSHWLMAATLEAFKGARCPRGCVCSSRTT